LKINSGGATKTVRLGADLAIGERPQAVVPAHAWQAAASLGDWTLVGCTVARASGSKNSSWRRRAGRRPESCPLWRSGDWARKPARAR